MSGWRGWKRDPIHHELEVGIRRGREQFHDAAGGLELLPERREADARVEHTGVLGIANESREIRNDDLRVHRQARRVALTAGSAGDGSDSPIAKPPAITSRNDRPASAAMSGGSVSAPAGRWQWEIALT